MIDYETIADRLRCLSADRAVAVDDLKRATVHCDWERVVAVALGLVDIEARMVELEELSGCDLESILSSNSDMPTETDSADPV